jgi:adenosylmethionine-8-amino-7-oxononanoate aminotransferase
MYSPEALASMIRLARSAGSLLFADEVMTGFYRTGRLFASEWVANPSGREFGSLSVVKSDAPDPELQTAAQLTAQTAAQPTSLSRAEDLGPDLISLSKGLTGGMMALGITACREQVYQAFHSTDRSRTFFHGHSYTANPLACAVSLASLDITLSDITAQAVARISQRQSAFIQQISTHPRVAQARSQGTIWAFEWKSERESSYFHPIRDQLYRYFLSRDLLLRPLGNTVYTMPPYCFEDEHLDAIQAAVLAMLEHNSWME